MSEYFPILDPTLRKTYKPNKTNLGKLNRAMGKITSTLPQLTSQQADVFMYAQGGRPEPNYIQKVALLIAHSNQPRIHLINAYYHQHNAQHTAPSVSIHPHFEMGTLSYPAAKYDTVYNTVKNFAAGLAFEEHCAFLEGTAPNQSLLELQQSILAETQEQPIARTCTNIDRFTDSFMRIRQKHSTIDANDANYSGDIALSLLPIGNESAELAKMDWFRPVDMRWFDSADTMNMRAVKTPPKNLHIYGAIDDYTQGGRKVSLKGLLGLTDGHFSSLQTGASDLFEQAFGTVYKHINVVSKDLLSLGKKR
jgi:hypothetical protein